MRKEHDISGGVITEEEKRLAKFCLETAGAKGADGARISMNKSILDTFSLLNGSLDKVAHSADRSIYIYIFADNRYGTFSTNRLVESDLERFVEKAVETVRMLAEDKCRKLPSPERTAKNAAKGDELGLADPYYFRMTSEKRLETAFKWSLFDSESGKRHRCPAGTYMIVSEECEYSDSIDDNYTIDSNGFEGRHIETSFACCSEITIEDDNNDKYTGYWWDASTSFGRLQTDGCSRKALEKAAAQIAPRKRRGGKFNMIVDRSVSSRLIAPVISALNASAIQQDMSFLKGCLGRQVFSEKLELYDRATSFGKPGSRLYDTEGVATCDRRIIGAGVVEEYFTNTYMAAKTGMKPTVEGISRPVLTSSDNLQNRIKKITLHDLMRRCRNGILVTGFNGGNCNPVTGDFSYGIEGFAFKDGKISHPVKEMVITGTMTDLWCNFMGAADDARECTRWQIPGIAFRNVRFNA